MLADATVKALRERPQDWEIYDGHNSVTGDPRGLHDKKTGQVWLYPDGQMSRSTRCSCTPSRSAGRIGFFNSWRVYSAMYDWIEQNGKTQCAYYEEAQRMIEANAKA